MQTLTQTLADVSVLLGVATVLGMAATGTAKAADSLAWLALTTVVGLGFMLSLLLLIGAQ